MSGVAQRLDTRQQVELVDGVEVSLRIAGPFVRGRAWLIDLIIKGLMLFALSLLIVFASSGLDDGISEGLLLLGMFGIMFFYNVIMEAGEKGATFGKRSCGLKVVTLAGGKVTFGQSIVRNLLRIADMNPILPLGGVVVPSFALGLVSCLFTKRFQRVGDLAAGTLVVYTKEYSSPDLGVFSDEAVERPPVALSREEQKSIVEYFDRGPTWTDDRKVELANHLEGLTGARGLSGAQRTVRMGRWLKEGDKERDHGRA